jgi:5'-3' exonuclease
LFTAVSQARPKKDKETKKYKTVDFIQFYKHLMLNSLRLIQKKYQCEYGEMVLCLDVRGNNWRKDFYPDYKAQRAKSRDESDINFEEFYEFANQFIEQIREIFPYKVIGVKGAEGDDVIAILAKNLKERTLVISEDKDFKQLLKLDNIALYAPIKQSFVSLSKNEMEKWTKEHILSGDSADNVPNIKQGTEFSDAFISYLKTNDIHVKQVNDFNSLTISEKLYKEFTVQKKFKSGPNKGIETGELDIFKTVSFGAKAIENFILNLEENLNAHPMYRQNYERNKTLVMFSEIPKNIEDKILAEFSQTELFYNKNSILTFLGENNFIELAKNVQDFYLDEKQFVVKETSSLDDWL